jgi:hypothetical protein
MPLLAVDHVMSNESKQAAGIGGSSINSFRPNDNFMSASIQLALFGRAIFSS